MQIICWSFWKSDSVPFA